MGITSRRKRPLDRKIPHLRDTNLIIIAVEGEKTEKQYFESRFFQRRRIQVKVLETKGGKSAPVHVFNRLKKYASETELHTGDQLWLMVDKDRWTEKSLSYVCSHAIRGKKQKVHLAISNPCFELWLFLHFYDWNFGVVTSNKMKSILRQKIGAYNPSNIKIEKYIEGIEIATKRARLLDNNPGARWPENPGTHVYRIVKEINKMSR